MDPKLLTGFLELLILETLSAGPSYGYAITQEVLSRSGARFELKEGSLYPALHRLEREKLLKSSWGEGDGRQRKYYEITSAGRKALDHKKSEWAEFAAGINGVLGLRWEV